ncbi:MAG: pyridoxamine 5'-phosphate oxidase family protein [Rhodospirillaceae bacterium]|nr:pyridoxamine 5'-phosphate oxidase family protein [Rhodospirillaceae bacterium]MBT6138856.1 pyridoxamine 5'-phosphate oxidase family protein [Rhodospirillaceae bacterium]
MSSNTFKPTKRSKVKRQHERGKYDHASVHAVLDSNPMCHIGYVIDGNPYVTPTLQWREGERVYFHGSSASRMLRTVREGVQVCLTVTNFDGFVLARSPMHHSLNYRSVMCFGTAHVVEGREAKEAALKIMMEGLFPGRWDEVRGNSVQEMKATMVLAMDIEEASAKVRTGMPIDDDEDYDTVNSWNGVVPLVTTYGKAEPDPRNLPGVATPAYLKRRKYP